MLPAHLKLTSPTQFRRTIKGGQRAGSRTLVVHVNDTPAEVAATGPRFGVVVCKAVGNAVVRHRTARRLRHVCMSLVSELPATLDVVIRALPKAADAPSELLARDLRSALHKAGVL